MKVIDLIPGEDNQNNAAFSRELMDRAGIDSMDLSAAVAALGKKIAPLIEEGKGVAIVVYDNGEAGIIGISAPEKEDE